MITLRKLFCKYFASLNKIMNNNNNTYYYSFILYFGWYNPTFESKNIKVIRFKGIKYTIHKIAFYFGMRLAHGEISCIMLIKYSQNKKVFLM